MTLTEFLLARIAEDEEDARDAHYDGQVWIPEEEAVVAADRDLDPILLLDRKSDACHAANWSPARVLAECAAKRRIVTRMAPIYEEGQVAWDLAAEVIGFLAMPYADQPDYSRGVEAVSEQTAEYGYRLTDEERALIASKSPGNDETAGWEYALLFRTVESVIAARLASYRDEWKP